MVPSIRVMITVNGIRTTSPLAVLSMMRTSLQALCVLLVVVVSLLSMHTMIWQVMDAAGMKVAFHPVVCTMTMTLMQRETANNVLLLPLQPTAQLAGMGSTPRVTQVWMVATGTSERSTRAALSMMPTSTLQKTVAHALTALLTQQSTSAVSQEFPKQNSPHCSCRVCPHQTSKASKRQQLLLLASPKLHSF